MCIRDSSYVDPSSGVYREEDVPENSVIYVRITEEQAAEYAAQWSAQRGALMGILRNLVVLCLLAVIAYICLLFVTGRTGEDEACLLYTSYQLPGRRDADRAAERDPRGTDEERADYECQP